MSIYFDGTFDFPPKPQPVVQPGEFIFSAMHMDHGHLIGMVWGLVEAGGTLKSFYDPDPEHQATFLRSFPHAHIAQSEEEILSDPEVQMVAAAAVTCERAPLGIRVMRAGKDYFTAKAPLTTLQQLEDVRACIRETGRKYQCFYSERLGSASATFADWLIQRGAIGKVIHMDGLAPHKLSPQDRPDWFFSKEQSGGLLCDLGSHQMEQFLHFAGETDAEIIYSRTGNYANPDHPEFDDFADCMISGKNGATFYFRLDWFTPDGVRGSGDRRIFIVGTRGSIELRNAIDPALREKTSNVLILLDEHGEHRYDVSDQVRTPYFGQLILDTLHRTETAMTQEHCLKAAELCVKASQNARRVI